MKAEPLGLSVFAAGYISRETKAKLSHLRLRLNEPFLKKEEQKEHFDFS